MAKPKSPSTSAPSSRKPPRPAGIVLDQIPGYRDAMAAAQDREESLRDAAFIEGALEICGLPIVPLTLEKMALLMFIGSPFLCGGIIVPAAVAQFLWVLSPDYRARDAVARAAFTHGIGTLSFSRAVSEIEAFIDEETMDRPPSRQGGAGAIPITSFVASYIDLFASAYGWPEREILQTRMARLYQYVRQIQRRDNPKALFFNRITDRRRRELLTAFRKAQEPPAKSRRLEKRRADKTPRKK